MSWFFNKSSTQLSCLYPWQKAAQRDIEEHQRLMDATCLWMFVRPKLMETITNEYMNKIDEMWDNGFLG